LERLVLIFLDLPTGYILLEEAADDRSYATWKTLVDKRLEALGAPVRYLGFQERRPDNGTCYIIRQMRL
jgi:hypothetical protein